MIPNKYAIPLIPLLLCSVYALADSVRDIQINKDGNISVSTRKGEQVKALTKDVNIETSGDIVTTGNVGIGAGGNTVGKLHVSDAYSVSAGPSANSALVISDTSNSLGVALLSEDASRVFIEFRDQTARRFLIGSDSDDSFVMENGTGTERLQIDSGGHVAIGGASEANGELVVKSDNNTNGQGIALEADNSTAVLAQMFNDSNRHGTVRVNDDSGQFRAQLGVHSSNNGQLVIGRSSDGGDVAELSSTNTLGGILFMRTFDRNASCTLNIEHAASCSGGKTTIVSQNGTSLCGSCN